PRRGPRRVRRAPEREGVAPRAGEPRRARRPRERPRPRGATRARRPRPHALRRPRGEPPPRARVLRGEPMIRLAPLVPIELAAALALLLVLLEVVPLCRRSEASPGRRVLVALLWSAGVLLALLPLLGASVERPLASAPAG